MTAYRIVEQVAYTVYADSDYEAVKTFLSDPQRYFAGVEERDVLVDRGDGDYVAADDDEVMRAEGDS